MDTTTLTSEHMLKVVEVCAMTGLSKSSVWRAIDDGEFDVARLGPTGRIVRVSRASVLAYLERRTIARSIVTHHPARTTYADLESPAPASAAA
jgi:excisionase family DNA binding protein